MIGINKKERDYIKYRPSLVYKKEILSLVEKTEAYTPDDSITNLLKTKPSGLLAEIDEASDIVEMMQERLEKCLEDTIVNDMTIKDYVSNATDDDGDKECIRVFDTSNALAINGTSQAECLPLLFDTKKELKSLSCFLNKYFYNNEANIEHLEHAEEKDEARITNLLNKDMANKLSESERTKLEKENFILEICHRRLNNCKNLTKQINELLCTTTNTLYNDCIDDVVCKYGEANIDVLESINDINKISFRKVAALCEEDKQRNKKLNSPSIKEDIQGLFVRIGELKAKSDKILEWATSIDTDYDQNNYTQIVTDAFDQVELIQAEFEKVALEVFKQIRLDEIVKNDIVDTLKEKKALRQKIALISSIIEEKKNGTFDSEELIKNLGLRNPGTMCSK